MLPLFLVKSADERLKVEVDLSGCLVFQLLLKDASLYLLQLHLTRWSHALQALTGKLPLLGKTRE